MSADWPSVYILSPVRCLYIKKCSLLNTQFDAYHFLHSGRAQLSCTPSFVHEARCATQLAVSTCGYGLSGAPLRVLPHSTSITSATSIN